MSTATAEAVKTAKNAEGEQIRLATASGLEYKAYRRPYAGGDAPVLMLFASGFYSDAPWEIFFQPVQGSQNRYRLLEKVPTIVYFIISYYAASYSSQVGLGDLKDTVIIEDAQGEHEVPVEPLT